MPRRVATLNMPPARPCERESNEMLICRFPTVYATSVQEIVSMIRNAPFQYDACGSMKTKISGAACEVWG